MARDKPQWRQPPVVDGRVPPHSLDAEAAVLSAALLSEEALDSVADFLATADFYSDANQLIWEALMALHRSGEPVDIVTVANWLRAREQIQRIGGPAYLGQLIDATPAVAHVRAHAEIIRDLRWTRQWIATCQKWAAIGYGPDAQAHPGTYREEVARELQDLLNESGGAELSSFREVMTSVVERARDVGLSERTPGLPTGFTELDDKTGGLQDGDNVIAAARPGMGKALRLDAKILTPTGWTTIGALKIGDQVIGCDGAACCVTGVFDQGELPVFKLTTSDGASTICCDDHLWLTRTRRERLNGLRGEVRSFRHIRQSMQRSGGGRNHSIPVMAPARLAPLAEELPVDPYLLGLWLGDGGWNGSTVEVSNTEPDILRRFHDLLPDGDELGATSDGVTWRMRTRVSSRAPTVLSKMLSELGLLGCRSWEKFVPAPYLFASIQQRTRLLQGLCDTDGYVTAPRLIEYTTASDQLAKDILFLAGSLGAITSCKKRPTSYTKGGERHPCRPSNRILMRFPSGDISPVSSEKHMRRWVGGPCRIRERFIATVEPAGRADCRCIAVDAPDQLYVTDDFLVTHNTSLAVNKVRAAASPETDIYVWSGEMPKEQWAARIMAQEANVDLRRMRQGRLTPVEWTRLTEACSKLAEYHIWIDDEPGITPTAFRARARRVAMRATMMGRKLVLAVADYLQLMSSPGSDNREQEVSTISRSQKHTAKALSIPVFNLSQLNRGVETRANKRPMLSDLRESGALEQDADLIMFLYRPGYYLEQANKADDTDGKTELIIAKQRNGPTGALLLKWWPGCAKFEQWEQWA